MRPPHSAPQLSQIESWKVHYYATYSLWWHPTSLLHYQSKKILITPHLCHETFHLTFRLEEEASLSFQLIATESLLSLLVRIALNCFVAHFTAVQCDVAVTSLSVPNLTSCFPGSFYLLIDEAGGESTPNTFNDISQQRSGSDSKDDERNMRWALTTYDDSNTNSSRLSYCCVLCVLLGLREEQYDSSSCYKHCSSKLLIMQDRGKQSGSKGGDSGYIGIAL